MKEVAAATPEQDNVEPSDKEIQTYLQTVYYDVGRHGSYESATRVWESIKEEGNPLELSQNQVKQWLLTQPVYARHRSAKRNFPRQKILVNVMDEQWDTDLMDLHMLSRHKKGFKYIVIFIDLFSRFLWAEPVKAKTSTEMLRVMKRVFKRRKPKTLRSDQGKEYMNGIVQKYLKTKSIHHFVAYNEIHANYAERVIGTLKRKLFRYFAKHQTYRYVDILDYIVEAYNNQKHGSIKMAPVEVTPENQQTLYEKIYLPVEIKQERTAVKFQYDVGDRVRVTYKRTPFDRGYQENYTEEIFTILRRYKTHPPRYKLKDYTNEPIKGSFYEPELQKAYVDENTVYNIEKVLRYRTVNKEKQALVQWAGYGKEHNSWISTSELVKIV